MNISEDNYEITKMALKALTHALPNCSLNFAIDEQREIIMSGIMRAISF